MHMDLKWMIPKVQMRAPASEVFMYSAFSEKGVRYKYTNDTMIQCICQFAFVSFSVAANV